MNYGWNYKLINLRTHKFSQTGIILPLSKKHGIGFYFDEVTPQFMGDFEICVPRSEAERIQQAEKGEVQYERFVLMLTHKRQITLSCVINGSVFHSAALFQGLIKQVQYLSVDAAKLIGSPFFNSLHGFMVDAKHKTFCFILFIHQ